MVPIWFTFNSTVLGCCGSSLSARAQVGREQVITHNLYPQFPGQDGVALVVVLIQRVLEMTNGYRRTHS